MNYELETKQQQTPQYNRVRRGGTRPSGLIVIHTAENKTVATGPDTGAEAVLSWILQRTDFGSYHVLADSDTTLWLAPWSAETFHDRNTNRHSVGISAAISCKDWPRLFETRDGTPARGFRIIDRMAAAAADFIRWMKATYDVTVPVRRLTQAEAHAGMPGFIGHGESDPGRRTDPGAGFNWDYFFRQINKELTPTRKDPFMALTDGQQATLLEKTLKTNAAAGRSEAREGEMLELLREIRDLLTVREKSVLLDKTYKTNAAVGRLEQEGK